MTELTWLGHATWLIATGQYTLLIDPYLDDAPTASIKSEALKPDYILVSHGHFDHIADAAKIANQSGATVISNFEICSWLQQQGVKNIEPMNIGGGINLPFGRVQMTIAHHSSALPDGSDGGHAAGFLLTLPDGKIYLAGDTGFFLDMLGIGSVGIDLAILPIGDRFTMGPDEALQAVKLIQPRRVLPSHYNTWPPIEQDAAAWADRVSRETKCEAIVLTPGGKMKL